MTLVVGGCGIHRGGPTTGSGGSAGSTSPGPPIPTSARQYPDRDPDQVAEGLVKLDDPDDPDDNCAILSTSVLDEQGFPPRTIGIPAPSEIPDDDVQPSCTALGHDATSRVVITIGNEFSESDHYFMKPLDLNGFIGYVGDRSLSEQDLEWACEVKLPVSFTTGISIMVKRSRAQESQFDSCVMAEELAAAAVATIVELAGPDLLFRTGEQHENAEGACVHWINGPTHEGCVPYRKATVPGDPHQLVQAVEANPNVACAATLDAVRDVLGEKMEPVTFYGRECAFVEPSHEIEFTISMTNAWSPEDYEPPDDIELDVPQTAIEVSGHPGMHMVSIDAEETHVEHMYFVSTGNDVKDPGLVNATLFIKKPRGSSLHAKADQTKIDSALPILERLMERF